MGSLLIVCCLFVVWFLSLFVVAFLRVCCFGLLCGVYDPLFVARCLLFVVCSLLYVVVVCCMFLACSLFVVGCC